MQARSDPTGNKVQYRNQTSPKDSIPFLPGAADAQFPVAACFGQNDDTPLYSPNYRPAILAHDDILQHFRQVHESKGLANEPIDL